MVFIDSKDDLEKALLSYINQNLPIPNDIKIKINSNINTGNILK